jgi:hypothetical protein
MNTGHNCKTEIASAPRAAVAASAQPRKIPSRVTGLEV